MPETELTNDHVGLSDTHVSRHYFRRFEAITGHLSRVAALMEVEGSLARREVDVLARHLTALTFTFRALSMKYLLAGRDTGTFFGSLTIDDHESGFPAARELMVLANDALQAGTHLEQMPTTEVLKRQMLEQIIGDRTLPTRMQFTLSQRLYYEELARGALFLPRNDPEAIWLETRADGRRVYLLHWAVYDSQVNLPVIYLMEVEDTGKIGLPKDMARWEGLRQHLLAQSLGGLKLLTIAQGVDRDFDHLHPKRLQRIHIGPMYSHGLTRQSGPIGDVLAQLPLGEDNWALAWTREELVSEGVQSERAGWFGTVEREVFALDPFGARGVETGATRTERAVILPAAAYQVLAELDPPGFAAVRKFVVGAGDRVLSYK